MAIHKIYGRVVLGLILLCFGSLIEFARAHGGVVEEEDICVIKINYLKGHFKIYQPRTDGHREYCEDLPNATESVFVMEYLHDEFAKVPIEFRIIRDTTGKGRFARWDDVEAIADLDAVTVFYRRPAVEPDVFTAVHEFDAEGDYIGIVTLDVGESDRPYRAVFPFEVGYTGLGYWPYIVGLLVLIQLQYLVMSGRLARWWKSRRTAPSLVVVAASLLFGTGVDAEEQVWRSSRDLYRVTMDSDVDPIPINLMHSWEIVVRTPDGEPVTGASITIDGGMPAHNHGLPTRPRVTAELGAGRYKVEGLRFHMGGSWEINVTIETGEGGDTVTMLLEL